MRRMMWRISSGGRTPKSHASPHGSVDLSEGVRLLQAYFNIEDARHRAEVLALAERFARKDPPDGPAPPG